MHKCINASGGLKFLKQARTTEINVDLPRAVGGEDCREELFAERFWPDWVALNFTRNRCLCSGLIFFVYRFPYRHFSL